MDGLTSGFRLAYSNYAFNPNLTATLSGWSLASGAVSNIDSFLTPQLSDRGSISGVGRTWINWLAFDSFAGGGDLPIDVVGLLNFSADIAGSEATDWRVRITNEANEEVYNSGWQALVPLPADNFPRHQWLLLPSTVMGSEVVISFNNSTEGATTITAGSMWVSRLWRSEMGIAEAWSMIPVDRSVAPISKGGQGYPRKLPMTWSHEFDLANLSMIEAYGDPSDASFMDIQQLIMRIGITEFAVVWTRTLDAAGEPSRHLTHRTGIYGQFEEWGRITHIGGDRFSVGQIRFSGRS